MSFYVRKVAVFLGIQPSYLAQSIKIRKFYLGRGFQVYKSLTSLKEITNCERYPQVIAATDGKSKKTEPPKN